MGCTTSFLCLTLCIVISSDTAIRLFANGSLELASNMNQFECCFEELAHLDQLQVENDKFCWDISVLGKNKAISISRNDSFPFLQFDFQADRAAFHRYTYNSTHRFQMITAQNVVQEGRTLESIASPKNFREFGCSFLSTSDGDACSSSAGSTFQTRVSSASTTFRVLECIDHRFLIIGNVVIASNRNLIELSKLNNASPYNARHHSPKNTG